MERNVQDFLDVLPERTQQSYRRDLELFLSFLDPMAVEITDVQRYHVLSFVDRRRHLGDAPATIRRRVAAVGSFYSHLGERGHVADSPTVGVDLPPAPLPGGETITFADLRACIDAASWDPEGTRSAVLAALFFIGLRLSVDDIVDLTDASVDRTAPDWFLEVGAENVDLPAPIHGLLPRPARHAEVHLLGGASAPTTRQTIGRWTRGLGETAGLAVRTGPRVLRRSALGIALTLGVDPNEARRRDWTDLSTEPHPFAALAGALGPELAAWS